MQEFRYNRNNRARYNSRPLSPAYVMKYTRAAGTGPAPAPNLPDGPGVARFGPARAGWLVGAMGEMRMPEVEEEEEEGEEEEEEEERQRIMVFCKGTLKKKGLERSGLVVE